MTRSRAQRSIWPLAVIASFGSVLTVQACSGRVQDGSDCRSDSSCAGGVGAAGGKGEAGGAALAGNAGDSGAGNVTPNACENSTKDTDESDVDCGGSSRCDRCPTGGHCRTNQDCEIAFCQNGLCKEPSCFDGVKNQAETGIDCGGSCQSCDQGTPCLGNEDCSNQYCAKGVCADHCLSGSKESDETDKDCGGATCKPCADNNTCRVAADCQSLVCTGNKCRPATCSDELKNQDESDTDCGGVCSASKPCPVAAHCNTPADCESWLCSTTGKCRADILIAPADVIDDFEDGDLILPANPALGGRVGNWYSYGDGSGTSSTDVFAIERGASVNGLHTTGKDFANWGSGVRVDLSNSGAGQSSKVAYDASAYSGVTFWARAQSVTTVAVGLPDADTDAAGKTCSSCDHHYYKSVQFTPNWQRFTVAFSDLALESGSIPMPTAFKPSGVVSVLFGVKPGQDYDLYLDDVAFVKK